MSETFWRWSAILLLSGGIIFWIGAFTPPYRQWTTSDLGEYLSIIRAHPFNWYLIHACFLLGVVLTILGVPALARALAAAGAEELPLLTGTTAFLFGSAFWVLNIAFRVTVTIQAAEHQNPSAEFLSSFQAWMDWSNLLFSIYMVLAYAGTGLLGMELRAVSWLPGWVGWFVMIFGFGGVIGYIVRFPLYAPPLMVHLPWIVTGIMLLRGLRRGHP